MFLKFSERLGNEAPSTSIYLKENVKEDGAPIFTCVH